jgi:hypothetical protein
MKNCVQQCEFNHELERLNTDRETGLVSELFFLRVAGLAEA